MDFLCRIKVCDIPIIQNRKEFCNQCDFNRTIRCWMCHNKSEECVREWLKTIQDRYLYVMEYTGDPTRGRPKKCVWCGKKVEDYWEHIQEHEKTLNDVILYRTQRDTRLETVYTIRTGRWWAIGLTFGACQMCTPQDEFECTLSKTKGTGAPLSCMRCIHSLCLDVTTFIPKNVSFERVGMVLA